MGSKKNAKTLAPVLLVVGVVLLAAGFNEYGAFGAKMGRALSGSMSQRTVVLFISGGVCAALGLMKLLK